MGGHRIRLQKIRVGLHLEAWSEFGLSPVWSSVWGRDKLENKRLLEALAPLGQAGGPGVFTRSGGNEIVVPIKLRAVTELGDPGRSIAQQVIAIRVLLDEFPHKPASTSPTETPAPSDASPETLDSDT